MKTARTASVSGAFIGDKTKIARYDWNESDNHGIFKMLPKEGIKVNHSYQRDRINEVRVNEMASQWSWIRCGALSVAARDGQFWAMDGQHRLLAAMKRADIKQLPCMVFESRTEATEAGSFVALNSHKTAVTGVDRFRAMCVAGDPIAMNVQSMLRATGHSVGPTASSKTVSCILTIWKLFTRDGERMKKLWPLIADIAAGHPITDCLVRAIFGADKLAEKGGNSLINPPYRAKLIDFGASTIVAQSRKEIQIIGKGGERIETAALVKMLNKARLGTNSKIDID